MVGMAGVKQALTTTTSLTMPPHWAYACIAAVLPHSYGNEIDASGMKDSNSNLIENGANKRGTPYHFTLDRDGKGGNFQGGTLTFDLSAHSGSTANVILAAEPVDAPNTLCVIANITGVTIP